MSDPLEHVRERRAGLRTAIGQVESSLASPAPGRVAAWSEEVREQLEVLSAGLDHHVVATEGPEGLLADIVEAAPRLAHRADLARRDHVRLRGQLDDVIALLRSQEIDVDRVRDDVVELLTGLVRHRQAGADLIYEAYNVDIEGGD